MRKVEISEAVWAEIAKRGKFGETVDDVLKRVFNLVEENKMERQPVGTRPRYAQRRMSTRVNDRGSLEIQFGNQEKKYFQLPDKTDKSGIRRALNEAIAYAEEQGASLGQVNAVRKALTSAGYHLTK